MTPNQQQSNRQPYNWAWEWFGIYLNEPYLSTASTFHYEKQPSALIGAATLPPTTEGT